MWSPRSRSVLHLDRCRQMVRARLTLAALSWRSVFVLQRGAWATLNLFWLWPRCRCQDSLCLVVNYLVILLTRQLSLSTHCANKDVRATPIRRIQTSFGSSAPIANTWHMDSSLHEVWQAAAGSPFLPTVGKGNQFLVAFVLMLLGLTITGVFALSLSLQISVWVVPSY